MRLYLRVSKSVHDKIFTMKSFAELGRFFALKRSTVGLLAMVVLVGMGEYLAERFLPIYIIALGGGAMVIGLLQAMDNFLSAIYSYPGGYLSERLGTKRALLLFNFVSIVGYLIVVLFPVWQAVLVGAAFFISCLVMLEKSTLLLSEFAGEFLSEAISGVENLAALAEVKLVAAYA